MFSKLVLFVLFLLPLTANSQAQSFNHHVSVTIKDMYGRQETKSIPIDVYKPNGPGPFPFIIFNHGRPSQEQLIGQGPDRFMKVIRHFVSKGYVVLFPTRIGYGENTGSFDPEGIWCKDTNVEETARVSSDQVLATYEFAKSLPYVDTNRWFTMGISMGGWATLATVWRNPPGLIAGINFSGGTNGHRVEDEPCVPHRIKSVLKENGKKSKIPTLWVYWENDHYWGPRYPKEWFEAWNAGNTKSEFASMNPVGEEGHIGLFTDARHWMPVVDEYMESFNKKQCIELRDHQLWCS